MNKGNKLGPLVALEKHEMRLTANLPVVTAMHFLAFPAWTCGLNNGLGLTPQVNKSKYCTMWQLELTTRFRWGGRLGTRLGRK